MIAYSPEYPHNACLLANMIICVRLLTVKSDKNSVLKRISDIHVSLALEQHVSNEYCFLIFVLKGGGLKYVYKKLLFTMVSMIQSNLGIYKEQKEKIQNELLCKTYCQFHKLNSSSCRIKSNYFCSIEKKNHATHTRVTDYKSHFVSRLLLLR